MNNSGYIYMIKNSVNGKMYIGQTSKTIEERFRLHIHDSENTNGERYNYPLYRAFRKYGIENFIIKEIERCDVSFLDDKEIYWINYYNSYNNGYNQTLGGGGSRTLNVDEKEVINTYNTLKNLSKTAKEFNCNYHSIKEILLKNNVKIFSTNEIERKNGNHFYQYDKNGNLLNTFNGRTEVGKWIIKNGFSKSKIPYNAGDILRHKFKDTETIELYGYIWKIDRFFDSKNYKKRKKYNRYKTCPICGSNMDKSASKCIKCEKIRREQEAIKAKENNGITRDYLKEEIRTSNFEAIGKKHNVSGNAIRKWCKLYGLPTKASEIKKYSDKEWEKV